MDSKTGSAEI